MCRVQSVFTSFATSSMWNKHIRGVEIPLSRTTRAYATGNATRTLYIVLCFVGMCVGTQHWNGDWVQSGQVDWGWKRVVATIIVSLTVPVARMSRICILDSREWMSFSRRKVNKSISCNNFFFSDLINDMYIIILYVFYVFELYLHYVIHII